MPDNLPAPLVAAEVDLRDFAYMPLDVRRLRDSDLTQAATAAEFRAAVLLWCACWHQIPAASLPNDDKMLAFLAGFAGNLRQWRVIKAGAMRGFKMCSDGRYYHPVIAVKAMEGWAKHMIYQTNRETDRGRLRDWREAKRVRKHNDETEMKPVSDEIGNAFRNASETSKKDKGKKKENPYLSVGSKESVSRRRQIPADWLPSEAGFAYALAKANWNHDQAIGHAEHFRDHHRSNAKIFADHDAAWRTWVRNGAEFRLRNGNGAGSNRPRDELKLLPWAELSDAERSEFMPGYIRPT